jgi:hypothetical protein
LKQTTGKDKRLRDKRRDTEKKNIYREQDSENQYNIKNQSSGRRSRKNPVHPVNPVKVLCHAPRTFNAPARDARATIL